MVSYAVSYQLKEEKILKNILKLREKELVVKLSLALSRKREQKEAGYMKKSSRFLALFITFMLVLNMLPFVAMASSETPTTDGSRIYANGTPVVLKEVSGVVNMYAADDTALSSPLFSDVGSKVIYGGWANEDHTGNTSITILSGIFSRSVYGGSREGTITGNTNLNIQGGTFNNSVYGGSALAGADISGCANVTAESAVFNNCTVFGAGSQANTVSTTNVTIKNGNYAWVYGGGDAGSVTDKASLTIEDGTFGKTIFGGSNSGNVGNTDVSIKNGTFEYVYGGGWIGEITGDTSISIVDGKFMESVYGGGAQNTADVLGNTNTTIEGGTYLLVFGGGYAGNVTGSANVTINGGIFWSDRYVSAGTVWGGGFSGGVGRTNLIVNSTDNVTVNSNKQNELLVYGGGQHGAVSDTSVKINGGNITNAYAAGLWKESAVGNAAITVGGNATVKTVYGGGDMGNVTGDTKVVIEDQAYVSSNVFGGCSNTSWQTGDANANVAGSVRITLKDMAVVNGCIFGGGTGTVGSVNINLEGGTIEGRNSLSKPVCGGGINDVHDGGNVIGAAIINVYPEIAITGGKDKISLNGQGGGTTVGSGSKINNYYKVIYDANTGTGAVPQTGYIISGVDTAAAAVGLTKNNNVFAGWNTQKNGDGSQYAAGDVLNLAKNETLYAQWNPAPSVPVTKVTVSVLDGITSIVNGGTLQMSAAILPDGATDKSVTWGVTNGTGSATISDTGLLTATGVGTLTVKATAKDGSGIYGTADITVTATTASKELTIIAAPSAITSLTNGMAKTVAALGLPATVTLVTNNGNISATVTWDVASCSYNASSTAAQTFTVNGTVTLPSGVVNIDSISLTTSISITVNAASGSSGGGISSGGSSSGGSTSTTGNNSSITVTTDAGTTTAAQTVSATTGSNGVASANVTKAQITNMAQ